MPHISDATAPQDEFDVILRRIEALERKVRLLSAASTVAVQRSDTTDHPDPVIGETVLHVPDLNDADRNDELTGGYQRRKYEMRWWIDDRWHNPGKFVIKIDDDQTVITVGNDRFIYPIPNDLDGSQLYFAEAFVTTAGGAIEVRLHNKTQANYLLIDNLHIDSGELHSGTATLREGIKGNNPVAFMDQIAVDVVSGSGAKGFGVALGFS